jgi:hypothetical protein
MPSDEYSVKVNRRDGVVEIIGPDKDWVAQQLERLAPIFEAAPPGAPLDTVRISGSSDAQPTNARTAAVPRTRRSGGTRASAKASKSPELAALLAPDVKKALQAYRNEREAYWNKKQSLQPAIVATFLADNLAIEAISADDLYTVYTTMGWPGPSRYRSQLTNAQTREKHFGTVAKGKFPLTHAGENFGRHTSKEPLPPKSSNA